MKIRKILLLAGEESGLIYAERLKDLLQETQPDAVLEFRGYQSEGFKTADLAVMGLWLVLKRIFFFLCNKLLLLFILSQLSLIAFLTL